MQPDKIIRADTKTTRLGSTQNPRMKTRWDRVCLCPLVDPIHAYTDFIGQILAVRPEVNERFYGDDA